MSEGAGADQAARARQQAEHRAIVQAAMQARRAGKLPAAKSSGGSEVVTAVAVVVAVIATLALAMRYGN